MIAGRIRPAGDMHYKEVRICWEQRGKVQEIDAGTYQRPRVMWDLIRGQLPAAVLRIA